MYFQLSVCVKAAGTYCAGKSRALRYSGRTGHNKGLIAWRVASLCSDASVRSASRRKSMCGWCVFAAAPLFLRAPLPSAVRFIFCRLLPRVLGRSSARPSRPSCVVLSLALRPHSISSGRAVRAPAGDGASLCVHDAIPPRVTCGPATCPRVEEHLGKPCRQAQVRDEEFIIDTGKLCPAGRTYRKDPTAASSPGSGKLCPGFTASQGLAGPRRQADRPSCGSREKKFFLRPPEGWGLSRDLGRFRDTRAHRQIRRCGRMRPGRTDA